MIALVIKRGRPYHGSVQSLGYQHMFSWRWLHITFSIIGPCEHGDDYSEAKIITERCALAHCSVVSQYITRFQLLNPICFALGKFLFAYLLVPTTFDMFDKRISGLWLYFVVSIGITACSIIMDISLVIKTAERHLIYFIATKLMFITSDCFHFVAHLFFIY